jgi:hypothetical protein
VAFQGGIDGTDPVRRVGDLAGEHEDRKATQGHLASGTLACPRCDAPVAPGAGHLSPADPPCATSSRSASRRGRRVWSFA